MRIAVGGFLLAAVGCGSVGCGSVETPRLNPLAFSHPHTAVTPPDTAVTPPELVGPSPELVVLSPAGAGADSDAEANAEANAPSGAAAEPVVVLAGAIDEAETAPAASPLPAPATPTPRFEELARPEQAAILPPPLGTFEDLSIAPADRTPREPLPLDAVIESVERAFPEVAEAAAEQATARGEELAAWGAFDTVLEATSINQPLDYYENYRHGVGVTRPLWSGGAVSAGYRIGRGDFEPWYGGRETNEGGEFAVGFQQPLLQGQRIDPRRVAVRTAALRRQATDPNFRAAVLGAQGAAARAYWGWVLAGFTVRVQQELLELGRERVEQIEKQIAAGDLGRIAGIDNARLMAQREAALIQAERGLQVAAVNLSIYLRDAGGMPIVAPSQWLPQAFPTITPPQPEMLRDAVARAPLNRPEPQALQLEAAALRVELAGAANLTMPQLDAAVEASQDVGGRSKPSNDKQPLKLIAAVEGSLPVQRRAGRGRMAAIQGKLNQNRAQAQLVSDRITAEAREAAARLVAAWEQIERAEANLDLAQQALQLGRLAFEEGDIDLLLLNIYEQSVADAQLQLYSAQASSFAAAAEFEVAVGRGLSPREEADGAADAAP